MRWTTILFGLLSSTVLSEARSWQHVGKRSPLSRSNPAKSSRPPSISVKPRAQSKFLNSNTTSYAVNGTGLPDVDFDVGESYSGLLSLTDDPDGDQKLFFWFFPSAGNESNRDIVIWLNGGPGCSSLEGLIHENGPFLWQVGTYKPVPNPWSWHRLTNIVYIEQPVGTGFSSGPVTATSEEDVAKQFMGFWKNFMNLFAIQGYNVYVAGESYAGAYCPYIASAFVDANDTSYYNVKGMMIYDPVIGNDTVQTSTVTVPFVNYHRNLMPFNNTFNQYLQDQHAKCGFDNYTNAFLQYPPSGIQPVQPAFSDECSNLWNDVFNEVFPLNPCFDVYQVATTCPLLWDVIGFPGSLMYVPQGASIYFDRPEVKAAIHAPLNTTWAECSSDPVFVNNTDLSEPSSIHAIPNVIEHTQNVIIGHGMLDMVLIANGTLLTIQNMTWGGKLGFQSEPLEPFYVPFHNLSTYDTIGAATDSVALATIAAAGVMGTTHHERGLTYVSVDLSGHMVPQYAPSAAFRQLEVLLGRIGNLSSTEPFTIEQ